MTITLAQDDLDRSALLAAAQGCVSGTLAEWPRLDAALRRAGYPLLPDTRAGVLQRVARHALGKAESSPTGPAAASAGAGRCFYSPAAAGRLERSWRFWRLALPVAVGSRQARPPLLA